MTLDEISTRLEKIIRNIESNYNGESRCSNSCDECIGGFEIPFEDIYTSHAYEIVEDHLVTNSSCIKELCRFILFTAGEFNEEVAIHYLEHEVQSNTLCERADVFRKFRNMIRDIRSGSGMEIE